MKGAKLIGSALFVVACLLSEPSSTAATIQTFGAGSAVASIDRFAEFDPLAVNGTPISDYTEGGLRIAADGDSWVGDGSLPPFDPFHGANLPDRLFFFPFGGSPGWTVIDAVGAARIFALEFMYGNGWTTGDIYGVPWGNHDAIVAWQTWSGGSMVSSGTIGGAPLLEMGTVLGFYDPAGFDRLLVRCTIASSGDPNLQALALDNLHVQLTDCSALNNCSGHGACVATNTCVCGVGWIGVDCSIPASGGAGRVPDGSTAPPLTASAAPGNTVDLAWSASCLPTDADYAIYEGALGSFTSHQPVMCSTGGATAATILPLSGNRYFLAVPLNGTSEGSYGLGSGGLERPPAVASCLPQQIGTCP